MSLGAREGPHGNDAPEGGPEEIGAATQQRLLGAFPRLQCHARRQPVCVAPNRYGPQVRDALLDDLDDEQRTAVTAPERVVAILAPAGSGKTRVLTRRIAYRVREGTATARHVLALTFTRKAAGELVDRIRTLVAADSTITAGTFHAVALAQLRRRAADHGREPPQVLDRKARVLAPLLRERGPAAAVAISDVAAEIEWAKARMIGPDEYARAADAAGRRLPRPAEALAELYARYEAEKRKRRVLDFDDVLRECVAAMAREPEFAAAQHWRFRHLFVDEFQDATPLQLALVRAWCTEVPDLCVVGDPAQAIYGFAGADARPLREFAQCFSGGMTVALTRNYRCTPEIVSLAETVLASAAGPRPAPQSARFAGEAPTVVAHDTSEAEAESIARACRGLFAAGVPWRDIAVLFRTNAQSARFEAAFTARGVPFRVGDDQRFATRPAVAAILDRLRELERTAAGRPFAEYLADLATDTDLEATDELRMHRDAVLDLGREYVAVEGGAAAAAAGSVASFAAWLDTATRARAGEDAVELCTFHRAKGLEWPVVFVTGLERGLVPIAWAKTRDALAEERRLLHVAFTRAEEQLHCSWARARTIGARRASREPSPWLGEIEMAARALRGTTRGTHAHLADVRATLAAAEPAAPVPRFARRVRR
jgi:DNA helicase-2/ATP-dependent DNA helicase PcrA